MINNDHNNWQKEFKVLEGKHKLLMKAMMEDKKKYEATIKASAAAMKAKDEIIHSFFANEQSDFQEISKSFEILIKAVSVL